MDVGGVAFAGGYLYTADDPLGDRSTVRKVSMRTGQLSTPAGTDSVSPSGDGGPAAQAGLDDTAAVAIGPSGSLALPETDPDNSRVRLVAGASGTFYGHRMTAGDIYTVAGTGTPGYSGDGGPATSAEFDQPIGVAFDAAGNLLVSDSTNDRIRVVAAHTGAYYGQAMTTGHVYTIAGDGGYFFSGDGTPATSSGMTPSAVAVDGAGNVLIDDWADCRILVVAAAAGTYYGQAMTAGDIYSIAGDGNRRYSGDGGPATSAGLDGPDTVALDAAGNLLLSEADDGRIRVVAARTGTYYGQAMITGDIYTIAGTGTVGFSGDGGPAVAAELGGRGGLATDSAGNVLIGDGANQRVRVIAESTGSYYGQKMSTGDIYTVAGNGALWFSGDGGLATRAELDNSGQAYPGGVGTDSAGDVLIADCGNNRIRMVPTHNGTYFGQLMTAQHIYAVAGNGTPGFSGDGGLATRAELYFPAGVTEDQAGNLIIADSYNTRIRAVAARTGTFYGLPMTSGHIYTIAGGGSATGVSSHPVPAIHAHLLDALGVAVDADGNVLIAARLRIQVLPVRTGTFYGQKMLAGYLYNVAGDGKEGHAGNGGPALRARLDLASGVAVDGAGNVLIADAGNNEVRVVAESTGTFYGQAMTTGDIYDLAGNGQYGYGGDGGPGPSAELDSPGGVAADGMGNVVIADAYNGRVRVVAGSTDTFYGQAMTTGDIYTIAGNGLAGVSGDGGPATGAELAQPDGVAVDGAGDVLIADDWNNRVREVTG
jgi:hypothetical protein